MIMPMLINKNNFIIYYNSSLNINTKHNIKHHLKSRERRDW